MDDFPSVSDFLYNSNFLVLQTRNVDSRRNLGELPRFVSPILERISMLPNCKDDEAIVLDQLTV